MSKKYAEEKKSENRGCLSKDFVQPSVSHSPRNIFSSKPLVTKTGQGKVRVASCEMEDAKANIISQHILTIIFNT